MPAHCLIYDISTLKYVCLDSECRIRVTKKFMKRYLLVLKYARMTSDLASGGWVCVARRSVGGMGE